MGFKVKGNPGVIRIDKEVSRAIEKDRRKDATPNHVLWRWFGIDASSRPRRRRAGSGVIRIDGEVWRVIEHNRGNRESASSVLRRRLRRRNR